MKNDDFIYSYSRKTAREFFYDLQKAYRMYAFASTQICPILLINEEIADFLEKADDNEAMMLVLESKQNKQTYHHFIFSTENDWVEVDCDADALNLLGLSFLNVTPSQYRLSDLISAPLKQCLDVRTVFQPHCH